MGSGMLDLREKEKKPASVVPQGKQKAAATRKSQEPIGRSAAVQKGRRG
jgi:hypothetical protein